MFDQYFVMALEKLAKGVPGVPAIPQLLRGLGGGAVKAEQGAARTIAGAVHPPIRKVPTLFDISAGPHAGAENIMGMKFGPKPAVPFVPRTPMIHGPAGTMAAGNHVVNEAGGLTKLQSADYDYVVREAFKEELQKLAYSPEMIDALVKLALDLDLSGKKIPAHITDAGFQVKNKFLPAGVITRAQNVAAHTPIASKAPGMWGGIMKALKR